jgi:hypothetical protein
MTGNGSLLGYGTSTTYTDVGTIENITDLPAVEIPKVAYSLLAGTLTTSVAGKPALTGKLSADLIFNMSTGAALSGFAMAATVLNWQVEVANKNTAMNSAASNNTLTFAGYITTWKPLQAAQGDGLLRSKLEIEPTTVPVVGYKA